MRFYLEKRKSEHPLNEKTFGSIYKNTASFSIGALLEKLGLKGKKLNNLSISNKHANFLINSNNANYNDIKDTLEYIETLVEKTENIILTREGVRIS